MLRCIFLLAALLGLPAFAQTNAPAGDAPPAVEVTPAPETPPAPEAAPTPEAAPEPAPAAATTAPAMTPEQRLSQFRHDQINLLALRGDAGSLLAAALMASADANDKQRPAALKFAALLKRAQTVGAESAMVWWISAEAECVGATKGCAHAEALQKLESLDAENAAVWTLSLGHARQANDAPAARAALARAAQAKLYNDYFGALIAAVYQAQSVLPMSADLLLASQLDAHVDGYRLIYAANVVVSIPTRAYAALTDACKASPADASLTDDCIAVARTMESSGTVMAQRIGLTLRGSLLPAGPELDKVHARERALAWQMQHMGELAGRLATDDRVTRAYTDALAETGDETAGVRAVLRSQQVALEPPANWQPPQVDSSLKP